MDPWRPMVTPFLSQIALDFGCDDVEGTVVYERVYHEAGATTHAAAHAPTAPPGSPPQHHHSCPPRRSAALWPAGRRPCATSATWKRSWAGT